MQEDPLCVSCTVLFSLLSREDCVLEALMPETHFCLWLNTNHLESLEKMVLVYSYFLDDRSPLIYHWNVHLHFRNSEILDLEVRAQVNFFSALLDALLIANLGKQCVYFSML